MKAPPLFITSKPRSRLRWIRGLPPFLACPALRLLQLHIWTFRQSELGARGERGEGTRKPCLCSRWKEGRERREGSLGMAGLGRRAPSFANVALSRVGLNARIAFRMQGVRERHVGEFSSPSASIILKQAPILLQIHSNT